MNRAFDSNTLPWLPVRPDITVGVSGRVLREESPRVVLTKVSPGGRFGSHRDPYGHLFYCLAGSGVVTVSGEDIRLIPGTCIQIESGVEHAYRNEGGDELLLISMNLPVPHHGAER